MARTRSNYGFFPAAGTDYTRGVEPTLAARLNRLGQSLKLHLIGISGYRSPSHSVSVGGFADDPHTQGRASDTPGIEQVPESTLERFGLTRPFPGAAEADHIQLLGARGGSTSTRRPGQSYTLADLWVQAGGPKNLAPIMAAIGLAESGGNKGEVGGPNTDGSYDYGLWQINSSHTQFNRNKLLSDPLYNARAAVSVYRSQGLGAWSTYTNGAYRSHLGQSSGSLPTFGRTRPGGSQPDASGPDTVFSSYTEDASWHWSPFSILPIPTPFKVPFNIGPDLGNPLSIFKDSANAVKDVGDFLKWIAWIFHPKNVLRIVEFTVGFTIMGFGLHTMIAVYRDRDPSAGAVSRTGRATRRAAGEAFSMTPPGRALRVKRATRFGKRRARAHTRETEASAASKRGERTERKRQARASDKRDVRKAKRPSVRKKEKLPF